MMRLNDKQTQVMNALTDRTLATTEEIRDATEIHSLTVTQVVCEQLEELGLVERAFGKWSATPVPAARIASAR